MSVSAYGAYAACLEEALAKSRPACRFDRLSSARALVVHWRNEVGFLPARAIIAKPLLRKVYTRDAYAPLLYRGTGRACAGHLPPGALVLLVPTCSFTDRQDKENPDDVGDKDCYGHTMFPAWLTSAINSAWVVRSDPIRIPAFVCHHFYTLFLACQAILYVIV